MAGGVGAPLTVLQIAIMTRSNEGSNPHEKECIALNDPQPVDHLGDLDVGDRVLIDERQRPVTVVATGTREIVDERIGAELETPVVKVQGHWDGATTTVLAHRIDRLAAGEDDVELRLEETDAIVDREIGRERDVRRTHVAGSKTRATAERVEVA